MSRRKREEIRLIPCQRKEVRKAGGKIRKRGSVNQCPYEGKTGTAKKGSGNELWVDGKKSPT